MDSNKKITHLTPEERRIIETGIRNGSTKTAIAKTIGKDNLAVYQLGTRHHFVAFVTQLIAKP